MDAIPTQNQKLQKQKDRETIEHAKNMIMLQTIFEKTTYNSVMFLLDHYKNCDKEILTHLVSINQALKEFDEKKAIKIIDRIIKIIPRGHKKHKCEYSALAVSIYEFRGLLVDVENGDNTRLREKYKSLFYEMK